MYEPYPCLMEGRGRDFLNIAEGDGAQDDLVKYEGYPCKGTGV